MPPSADSPTAPTMAQCLYLYLPHSGTAETHLGLQWKLCDGHLVCMSACIPGSAATASGWGTMTQARRDTLQKTSVGI